VSAGVVRAHDLLTRVSVRCEPSRLSATLQREFFPDCTPDVRAACDALQSGVMAGRYVGSLEVFLSVVVEPETDAQDATGGGAR